MYVNARTVAVSGKQTGGEEDMKCIYDKALEEFGVFMLDETIFPGWKKFVYQSLPNNWLKMHCYPKHRKAEQKHRGKSARSVIIDELESNELTQ